MTWQSVRRDMTSGLQKCNFIPEEINITGGKKNKVMSIGSGIKCGREC